MSHEEVIDLVDAYVIGALEPEEAAEVETHLESCAECSAALAEASEFAGLLALVAPLRHHSDLLWSRVVEEARSEQAATTAGPGRWRRFERIAGAAAAAAIASVLVWTAALQVQVRDLDSENDALQAQVADTSGAEPELQAVKAQAQQAMSLSQATNKAMNDYQTVLNVVSEPSVAHATMKAAPFAPDAEGEVYWDRERQVFVFMFARLPEVPDGKAYQLWMWKEGAATSGGTFVPNDWGSAIQIVPAAAAGFGDFSGIGVTLEDEGGAPEPTGPGVVQLPISE